MKPVRKIWKKVPQSIRESNKVRRIADAVNGMEWKRYVKKHERTYPVIKKPESVFSTVYRIKDQTYEQTALPETYKLVKESHLNVYCSEMNILKIKQACVSEGSDIVLTPKGAVYDRINSKMFSMQILCDKNLSEYSTDGISVIEYEKTVKVKGLCISLLGVHDSVWSHFLIQYFPKLGFAKRGGLLEDKLSILVPEYSDSQIWEILKYNLKGLQVNIVEAGSKTAYQCDILYYIPSAVYMVNHGYFVTPWNVVFPQKTKDVLREELVEPWIKRITDDLPKYDKVYLIRRGTYRQMKNWQEAEEFFRKEGFKLLKPHEYSLMEKVSIFSNAAFIAGPYSSAFCNVQWCSRKVKILTFLNLQRTMEATVSELASIAGVHVYSVTGQDDSQGIHSSYTIPMDTIKTAYYDLIHDNWQFGGKSCV